MWAQFSSFVLLCMGLEVFELQTSNCTGKLMSSLIFGLFNKLNVHAGGSYVLSHALKWRSELHKSLPMNLQVCFLGLDKEAWLVAHMRRR